MRRILVLVVTVAALAAGTRASQAGPANHDPDAARLITSDISNFWRAVDRAAGGNAADVFQHEYLDVGSPGLRDFTSRIESGRALAFAVATLPRYYASIRANTLTLDATPTVAASIRASFRRLKALDPDAVFPDVYFVIGRLSAGGTTSANGLLIGVEMNARDPTTPVDELSAWQRAVTGQISDLPYVVAHELVHVQQPSGGDISAAGSTLLAEAVREGSADFIGELIAGAHVNRVAHAYGDAHERELWDEFLGAMHGTDIARWIGQGDRAVDRPADLGYYIGYRVCETFYERATDKSAAVRQILQVADADAFLRQSTYAGGVR